MIDVREVALLMPGKAGGFRWGKLLSRTKLAIRWGVVATSRTPLRHLYRAIYRGHVWYAIRVAKRFPGTRAIYITRSMATGDITIGVSDIDMVMLGEWPEEEQIRLMRSLGILSAVSPLYDSGLWQQVHGVDSLRNLWETDYFFQSRFDEGRTQWKLAYGDDLVSKLPPVPHERLDAGYYMEVRNWWLHFIASAFGSGPTAEDAIFRNSIAYKAVTQISGFARALRTGAAPGTRQDSLRTTMEESGGDTRDFLDRLERSRRSNHLRFRGDIQDESVRFLLPVLDEVHASLCGMPSFQAIGEFQVDAHPDELLRTPSAVAHAGRLIQHVKEKWPSYRAAYLSPSAACFALDDLILLIEVDPCNLPPLAQLRELCSLHAEARSTLRQRISLYLLLPNGAYRLELIDFNEMWRVMVFPASTPDLFALIQRSEFRIDGKPVAVLPTSAWSRFARDLALEEVTVRRSVLSKVMPDAFPSSIEVIRNVYRHLQLEVLVTSAASGLARFALSPAAIERELRSMGSFDSAVLDPLREAYAGEMQGESSDVRPLIPRIIAYLQTFR